jgi:hypothetical protein
LRALPIFNTAVDDMTYSVWTYSAPTSKSVKLEALELDVEVEKKLWRGQVCRGSWPADATITTAKVLKKAVLPDFPYNRHAALIVSAPVAELLTQLNVTHVEYLPIRVGSLATYTLVNLLDPVDCIDRVQSGARASAIDPDMIMSIQRLVLDPSRIDPERALFRCCGLSSAILVRADLREALLEKGFSGVRMLELSMFS